MKPLGLFLSISTDHTDRVALDDDYDWYVQQITSARAASASAQRPRTASVADRVATLARLLRLRSDAPTARRI